MVYNIKLFIEVTTLKKLEPEFIYRILHKNIADSHIKIYETNKVIIQDV